MRAADMSLIVIVLGLVLFGGSFVYPQWSGSAERQWTEADAQEFVELSRKVHGMDHAFSSQRKKDPDARPSPEFTRVADSYMQKEEKLRKAQHAGEGVARVLLYLGIGLVCLGGFTYLGLGGSDGG